MKKLYRLGNERKIAGVCAGLGEHFDADPLLFRLFFLLSIFFGGFGILAYLIMWLMVPLKEGTANQQGTLGRLYLSNSNRKMAGVCGGLGEYFGLDPILFRICFVVLALYCGAGILLYLLLWLLVPRAPAPPSAATASPA